MLSTLDLGVWIREATLYKEEVVIAYPQVEGYDKELNQVETSIDIEKPARYLAELKVISHGRDVILYVRYYLTSKGELRTEECFSDSVSSEEGEEPEQPGVWLESIELANQWGPTMITLLMWLLSGSS